MPLTISKKFGRRYPWDDWLAGGASVTLVRGVDFNGRTDTFVQLIRRAAMVRRLGVDLDIPGDGKTVTITVSRQLGKKRQRGRRKSA